MEKLINSILKQLLRKDILTNGTLIENKLEYNGEYIIVNQDKNKTNIEVLLYDKNHSTKTQLKFYILNDRTYKINYKMENGNNIIDGNYNVDSKTIEEIIYLNKIQFNLFAQTKDISKATNKKYNAVIYNQNMTHYITNNDCFYTLDKLDYEKIESLIANFYYRYIYFRIESASLTSNFSTAINNDVECQREYYDSKGNIAIKINHNGVFNYIVVDDIQYDFRYDKNKEEYEIGVAPKGHFGSNPNMIIVHLDKNKKIQQISLKGYYEDENLIKFLINEFLIQINNYNTEDLIINNQSCYEIVNNCQTICKISDQLEYNLFDANSIVKITNNIITNKNKNDKSLKYTMNKIK